jgi:uncharacterized membrane-anchored protein
VGLIKQIFAALALAIACCGTFAQATPGEAEQQLKELPWMKAGATGDLDGKAHFKVSESYTFLASADTDKFLKLNGNPPPGNAVTIAPTKGNWFGILTFAPEGYVKDDEKIDADALLKSLRDNNEAGNTEKQKQGYRTLTLEGWALAPRYDRENKRLEWGTLLRSQDNQKVVNVSTRILGRSGYTSAILVTSPETLDTDLQDFKTALKDFDYVKGEKYSEWRDGDKVAAYGLGALVLGGAAAAVASKGGFKVIGLALLAAGGAIWGGLKKFFARNKSA